MMLCNGWCTQYVAACGASLQLPPDYCIVHSRLPDATYCYPYVVPVVAIVNPGQAVPAAFPLLQAQYPGQMSGLYMAPGTEDWWLLDQIGIIWRFPNNPAASQLVKVLDIGFKTLYSGEMGLLGEPSQGGLACAVRVKMHG